MCSKFLISKSINCATWEPRNQPRHYYCLLSSNPLPHRLPPFSSLRCPLLSFEWRERKWPSRVQEDFWPLEFGSIRSGRIGAGAFKNLGYHGKFPIPSLAVSSPVFITGRIWLPMSSPEPERRVHGTACAWTWGHLSMVPRPWTGAVPSVHPEWGRHCWEVHCCQFFLYSCIQSGICVVAG
jgi:hypothetical protein